MLDRPHSRAAADERSETSLSSELHIVTCEFPPKRGGVSDYTYNVAKGLAKTGETVHVWCPNCAESYPGLPGINIHADLGGITPADLLRLDRKINLFTGPRRILVQWVPHGYRFKSLNLPFCIWILKRATVNGDTVELMVHEPFLRFSGGNWKQDAAALMHRLMAICLLRAASKVWLSTSSWEGLLRPYCLGRILPFLSLPVPSNVSVDLNPDRVAAIRGRYAPNGEIILGHFGTYGRAITEMLGSLIPRIFETSQSLCLILMGKNSLEALDKVVNSNPRLSGQIYATGSLSGTELSHHIQACDLLMQPYPDGITTRRTSAMISLAHGRPIVTTVGELTESLWLLSNALALEPYGNPQDFVKRVHRLALDHSERARMGESAANMYANHFDLRHTITALRSNSARI